VVTGAVDTRRGSDFAGLCRQVRAARLLERRCGHYAARIALTGLAFAALWWMFAVLGGSWYQTIVDHRITYTESSLVGCYLAALRHLHALGAPLRVRP